MPRLIYLHGFASSPASHKAVQFARAFAARGLTLEIPDLNEGDFRGLTLSRQLALLARMTDGEPERSVVLLGSSMGAYVAALFAAPDRRVAAQVLMAPAFDLGARWLERMGATVLAEWERRGYLLVQHYATEQLEALGWSMVADARRQPPFPAVTVPTLIFHGRGDESVDWRGSERFAAERPMVELELLEADHGLGEQVPLILERTLGFLAPWLPAPGPLSTA